MSGLITDGVAIRIVAWKRREIAARQEDGLAELVRMLHRVPEAYELVV